jgi:hypothetical protein
MTGHPILILSQKIEFVFFSFSALKDLSKMISYLYFGYLDQKLYFKNPNSWAIFDTKHVFFKNRYFYKKKNFGQNELTCSLRKVQNKIFIFLSKIWRPNFYWCSIFSSCHHFCKFGGHSFWMKFTTVNLRALILDLFLDHWRNLSNF